MTVSLSAHFDGKSIILDDEHPLQAETKLLVTVIGTVGGEEAIDERRAWSLHSKQAMSRVFGDDEPEYSAADAIP